MANTILLVPGLRGSGAAHWQSLWQASHPEYFRVLQRDWLAPRLEDWAAAIAAALEGHRGAIVVAHGFGCLAALQCFSVHGRKMSGMLLAAPRDPEDFHMRMEAFEPLDLPATLVASRNDPDMPFECAKDLAGRLGSRLVDAGEAGHIDDAAGFGPWPRGERLLAKLVAAAQARERELQVALALAS